MKKFKRLFVGAVAVALAFGAASEVLGATKEFTSCMEGYNQTVPMRQYCCDKVGGSWVEIFDSKGNKIDEFCFGGEDGELSSDAGDQEPEPSDPRVGTSSGTYEQPESAPAPTRTGTTSGTYSYEQQSTPTTGESTSGGTTPTSGTYAR